MIYLSLSSGAQANGVMKFNDVMGWEKIERKASTLNSHLQFSPTLISNFLLSTHHFFLNLLFPGF